MICIFNIHVLEYQVGICLPTVAARVLSGVLLHVFKVVLRQQPVAKHIGAEALHDR